MKMSIRCSGNPFFNIGTQQWWVIQVLNVVYPCFTTFDAGHLFHEFLSISLTISCLRDMVFKFSLFTISAVVKDISCAFNYRLSTIRICGAKFAY